MKRDPLRRAWLLFVFCLIASTLYAQVSFFQPPSYAGSGNLFTADFNGDGKPDLLSSDGTLQLGNGDGTFKAGTRVPGTPLAVADFNGDGKPDLLEQGNGTLLVLLGDGDGTFQQAVSTASGAVLSPVAAGDLNSDGNADVVGVFNNTLVVYLSKAGGTFAPGVSYNLGTTSAEQPIAVSFGDFNGDSKTDIAVTVSGTNVAGSELVLLGNGDGTFQPPKTSAGLYNPFGYAPTGDFNGDGRLDLAVSSFGICLNAACTQAESTGVYLLAGNGDGTFQTPKLVTPAATPITGLSAPSFVAADVNGDGKLDLVLQVAGTAAQIYLGNGDGTFTIASSYVLSFPSDVVHGMEAPVAADFNMDGKLDVAVGNAVLLGNGNGTFQGIPLGIVPNFDGVAVVGEFDKRQSAPGVAVSAGQQAGSVSPYNLDTFSNDGHGILSLAHTYSLQQRASQIVTADLNGDGNLDLLVFSFDPISQNWSYSALLGNGNGSFQQPLFYPQNVPISQLGQNSVIVADFNNDKKPDFAVGGLTNQSLAIVLGKGDGTFEEPSYIFDGGDSYLVAADFNGDGQIDIAAGILPENGPGPETALLLGNGDGTFQPAAFPLSLTNFEAEYTADLNNDDKPDLLSNNQVALGNGDGTFTLLPLPPVPPSPGTYSPIAIADFNGDGILDLLVFPNAYHAPSQTGILLGNGDGTFSSSLIDVPQPINGTSAIPQPALIADMNGDGRPDIVFVSIDSVGGVGVMLNTTPANFALSATALSPSTVTAGNSASASVNVSRDFGFSGTVMLACSGLPGGASCAFTPASVLGGSTSSSLVLSTTSSAAAGTYPVEVQGTSGSLTHQAALSLVIQAPPDFTLTGPSATSQTINAGQSATFSLSLTPANSFSGTVSLSCAITPAATPAPTCTLSSSSVQISGTASQTVMVTVGTTAPLTTSDVQPASHGGFPPASIPLLALLGWLSPRKRRHLSVLAALLIAAAFAPWIGCSGGSGMTSSPSKTAPGTPAQTYTATVTATSGNLTQNTTLQVVVQ